MLFLRASLLVFVMSGEMKFKIITIKLLCLCFIFGSSAQQYKEYAYEPDVLDMDPDSILEENADISANATCGMYRREFYCHLVEHSKKFSTYGPRSDHMSYSYEQYRGQSKSYLDLSGQRIQCNYCDDRDPRLRHPIEYVLRGEPELWWQSPSLAEGLQYQHVSITMDFKQVYQIVYVLLRMGDSPRPSNWILERSLDGIKYEPWVFFAESEYECRRLYEPLLNGGNLTVTTSPRPWKLEDDEIYCTTYYSQPESLQSGEIIVTLPLDRASTISTSSELERAVSSKLIDFLSARFIRLRFQKLQTLSGDWMAMPNQLEQSVYNRGVPRAVCVCQHNTCGSNCETCCPMFNQQPWRPGRTCEECNCNRKADSCVFNQTVANLRLSMRRDGVYEGGGVCVGCREDTGGINCEKCKLGHYRPISRRPEESYPCVRCDCNSTGSTGECVSNDALVPEHYPGDCICKTGFAGKKCDECAIGYRRPSPGSPECVPCSCDIRGSHGGGSYRCEPPCNCKINVNPDSHCKTCQPGFFNLDASNPEGCQSCYCSGLTKQCDKVSRVTAMVSTLDDWTIIVPSETPDNGGYAVASHRNSDLSLSIGTNDDYLNNGADGDQLPLSVATQPVEAWLSSISLRPINRAYYWSAPKPYLSNQITAYRGRLVVIQRFSSPTLNHYFAHTPGMPAASATSRLYAMRDYVDQIWLSEPDVVLEGNGYRLAYFLPPEQRDSHLILDIPLRESSFRVLVEPPSSIPLNRLPINLAQGGQSTVNRIGRPATIGDLISVLADLERILVKAKYTNDQTQTELLSVKLVRANRNYQGDIDTLEECVCPHQHTGTSCESCAPGYWRAGDVNQTNLSLLPYQSSQVKGMWRYAAPSDSSTSTDTTSLTTIDQFTNRAVCVPCQCHGHSDTCNQKTGKCIDCQHNTVGDKCDACAPGYYGDPSTGDPNACRPCECPTLVHQMTKQCVAFDQSVVNSSNNSKQDQQPYVCLDCQENTRGRYCETCNEGFFGDPRNGIKCEKCDCGIGAIGCNATSGECICGMHTTGPRCEKCAEFTHGDPLNGQQCRPCDCHPKGSLASTCRVGDGQCSCKSGYTGVRCEQCVEGRGNVEAGCPLCKCDVVGTQPGALLACNKVTGQCDCKPGVGSLDCSKCEPGFYQLGPDGCKECTCSSRAIDLICDDVTGKCKCGQHVIGDTCDKCEAGHFWNQTGPNCLPCDCGPGALESSSSWTKAADCDMQSGQCKCAPHVTGRQCDECVPGFFGVSTKGCEPCPSCPNGQVCDQKTGKCICPVNTKGDQCEECSPNSWDYNPIAGCKDCNCSKVGTQEDAMSKCDLVSGQCECKTGFAGRNCSECALGYFGYPECRPCDCDASGTARLGQATSSDVVPCNPKDGSCQCKSNVQGKRCDECKPGTFGLNMDYEHGCYSCFCFPVPPLDGDNVKCKQLTDYLSVPGKEKEVEIISTDNHNSPNGPVINLHIGLGVEELGDLVFGTSQFSWRFSATRPTYLEIPELTGQLVRKYGSIMMSVWSECLPSGNCRLYPPKYGTPVEIVAMGGPALDSRPFIVRDPHRIEAKMVALGGYLELEYQPSTEQTEEQPGYRSIWLRERDWILTRVGEYTTRVNPTRNELMLALMNVTIVSVRIFMPEARPTFVRVKYRIYDTRSGRATSMGTPIRTIEKCECPPTALGDHCEIASNGFYFPQILPKPGPNLLPSDGDTTPSPGLHFDSIIWTGGAEKCKCHGMSSNCNAETGVCSDCSGNTVGPDCGECAIGYMGDPKTNQPCVKCQCPTEQTDYATTCIATGDSQRPYASHKCICKPGYAGERCEQCAAGFFGQPTSLISCQSCDCDLDGSQSTQCNQLTGQCQCWPGIEGRRCDRCQPDHVVENRQCKDCRGSCTGELLEKADSVKERIDNLNMTSLAYRGLERLEQEIAALKQRFNTSKLVDEQSFVASSQELARQTDQLASRMRMLTAKQRHVDGQLCQKLTERVDRIRLDVNSFVESIDDWRRRLKAQSIEKPSDERLEDWKEQARRALLALNEADSGIKQTLEWLSGLADEGKQMLDSIDKLSVDLAGKERRRSALLDKTASYQAEQGQLLDALIEEFKLIANSTQFASEETRKAEETAEKLKQTIDRALNLTLMQQFEDSASELPKSLEELEQLYKETGNASSESPLVKGEALLVNLTKAIDDQPIDQFTLPPELIQQLVVPLERESASLTTLLTESSQLKQSLDAREAYANIVQRIQQAIDATSEAESLLANTSTVDGLGLVKSVEASRVKLDEVVNDKRVEQYASYNKSGEALIEQVTAVKGKLATLDRTMDKTLDDVKDSLENVSQVEQLITDLQPMASNSSDLVKQQRDKLAGLENRLLTAENKFAALHGSAQHAVDQANTSQINLANALNDAESTIRQLDSKLLRLRRVTAEARSLLDVTYGALAKDPSPIKFEDKCVYSLVPYSLTRSQVFDIEFWFNLESTRQADPTSQILLAGRRGFNGRTQLFSFTIEDNGSKLRFRWNVADGQLEIGRLEKTKWYQVRVVSFAGTTKMSLLERPNQDQPLPESAIKEVVSEAGSNQPESWLALDNQMEIRVGGVLQEEPSMLASPESWGDNGAEELWAFLSTQEGARFCMFNLRLGGVEMSLVDLAVASPSCKRTDRFKCQMLDYRPFVRDGYVWQPQTLPLTSVTNVSRPGQSVGFNSVLRRMFYYDFAGLSSNGYARIEQLTDLQFCKHLLHFQATPVDQSKHKSMTIMTFYNFDEDTGTTVELINGQLQASSWQGANLYKSDPASDESRQSLDPARRRMLRSLNYYYYLPSRRSRTARSLAKDRRRVKLSLVDPSEKLWSFDSLLSTDCKRDMILFVGGIPPAYHAMRRRMLELGFTLNPFHGRIGLTTENPGQDGDFYLYDYQKKSALQFGGTRFTDLRQKSEARAINKQDRRPDAQFCLEMTPHDSYTELELKSGRLSWPLERGISMTLRFDPTVQMTEDFDLLSMQMASADWFRLSVSRDYKLTLVYPGAESKLVSQTSLLDFARNDPGLELSQLKLNDAQAANLSYPAWSREMANDDDSIAGIAGPIWERSLLLAFRPSDNLIQLLIDGQLTQSWHIQLPSSNMADGLIQQVFVGPNSAGRRFSINYLVLDDLLVDFANDLTSQQKQAGVRFGNCGGQLHPRFVEHSQVGGETVWLYQGLGLDPPKAGRDAQLMPSSSNASSIHARDQLKQPEGKIRRLEDCVVDKTKSAWFDQKPDSYWLIRLERPEDFETKGFSFSIGFRANIESTNSYTLLAGINYPDEIDNWYIILAYNQLILIHRTVGLLWSSPHTTLSDSNWHRLTFEQLPLGKDADSSYKIIFNGQVHSLPNLRLKDYPVRLDIGGSDNMTPLQLNSVEVANLFGCVDELSIAGQTGVNLAASGRPKCPECFNLDPKTFHLPISLQSHIAESNPVALKVPTDFLDTKFKQMTLSFRFFYNRNEVNPASLFVVKFQVYNSENDANEPLRLWLYLRNNLVYMTFLDTDSSFTDSVYLLNLPPEKNGWHFIQLKIIPTTSNVLAELKSQVSTAPPMLTSGKMLGLENIFFGLDEGETLNAMKSVETGFKGEIFSGCIRDLVVNKDDEPKPAEFPADLPGANYGYCRTSAIW